MNKLYNTQEDFASKIKDFLLTCIPDIRKTQLKIIPYIVIGMILSESVVPSDISIKLKGDFSLVKQESVIRRIIRFFTNKLFNPYVFYDLVIRYLISTYKKKHDDNNVHISFDHTFSHNNYVILMFAMRIGKQSIPIWFRCFKDKSNNEAYKESLIIEGINYINDLLGDDFNLIFLADRWFDSTNIMKHIISLNHIFDIRVKGTIKVLIYDKKEGHEVSKTLGDIKPYVHHSSFYNDVLITNNKLKVNIAISQSKGTDDPWIIITNGDPTRSIKDYGYRFGSIESLFKNQKSNGFYLENTVNASEKYYSSMYAMMCFSLLYLTILGTDYSKNSNCYKDKIVKTHKNIHGKKVRIKSLFKTGLALFNIAYNSSKYVRIPSKLVLYDI